jgi:hypothetical protein
VCSSDLHAADLDGDGDADLFGIPSASWGPPNVWFATGGGAFGPRTPLGVFPSPGPCSDGEASDILASDLDGDGDADLVCSSDGGVTSPGVVWSENLGGGAFGAASTLTTTRTRQISATDLDGDGDADVLASADRDDEVLWIENLGGHDFAAAEVAADVPDLAEVMDAADLDGDGDADVVVGSRVGGDVAWVENLGGGTFGAYQVLVNAGSGVWSVVATDLDGDADPDVVAASNNWVRWTESRGECLTLDADADGLRDAEELLVHGTDPTVADSDGDGLSDGDEVHVHGTDPTADDTDGDGEPDGADPCPLEVVDDSDGDGVCEHLDLCPLVADPSNVDADGEIGRAHV